MSKKFCLSPLCIALAVPVLAQDKQRLKDASGVLQEVLNSNAAADKPTISAAADKQDRRVK